MVVSNWLALVIVDEILITHKRHRYCYGCGVGVGNSGLDRTAQPQTRVEADQATGNVRIIAAGREVARFDKGGLHVRDNIRYGGTMSDAGEGTYRPKAADAR